MLNLEMENFAMITFENLNPMQKEAVLSQEGPVLILAGAGSGKTGALTVRMAGLIESGVKPWNILAITFTNKAAREMRQRVLEAVGEAAKDMWVSTFHSACVRILRRDIDKIGYDRNFSIYDTDDSLRVMKDVFGRLGFSLTDKTLTVKGALAEISNAKEAMLSPSDYMKENSGDLRKSKIAQAYREYDLRLKNSNALDFDDIIYNTVRLFKECPDVLDYYQEKFRYIMVDEYQDTNTSQYQLVRLLAMKYKNLCVVGDDDQSIYGWRGANIRNILDFEKDFPNTKVIKLEQNYRSTKTILKAANAVIKHNGERKDKSLWTDNDEGRIIMGYRADNEYDEGRFIAEKIDQLIMDDGRDYKDFAVLYRTNAQSRAIEEQFVKKSVPYRLCGGTRFYDRKEIRDIHSYLKAIANPDDDIAVKRIINVPKRGIGDTSVERASALAAQNNLSLYEVLPVAAVSGEIGRSAKNFGSFYQLMESLKKDRETMNSAEFIENVAKKTGYIEMLELEGTEEAQGRIENIGEFVSKAAEYVETTGDTSLEGFLEEVALVADVDSYEENENTVVLMTLHSAKGLEFPVVFLAGMEEGLFPGYRSIMSGDEREIEEERRLCYVGITRAREELYITHAKTRMQNGNIQYNQPSRFLKEIPPHIISWLNGEKSGGDFGIGGSFSHSSGGGMAFGRRRGPISPISSGAAYGLKSKIEAEIPQPKDFKLSFGEGDKVRAPKYGIGVVKSVKPAGADFEVEVSFPSKGTKKFMAKLSKLIKVD